MKKVTSRQIQAQKTKLRIYNASIDLFDKQGFENTTIEDISKKAGVSVGAFYHYFPSKSDIYYEMFERIDEYYRSTVEKLLCKEDFYENIILFFQYYARYNAGRGIDSIKQLYATQTSLFLDKDRHLYMLLARILKQGEEKDQITKEMEISEIDDLLCVTSRGLIYDWVLHGGTYDLEEKFLKYMMILRPVIVK